MGAGTSVRFTEQMKGFVSFGEADFALGFERGRERDARLMFRLEIEASDIDRFVADPRHEATAGGFVRCEDLGGTLEIERGVFNLFVPTDRPDERRMLYRLHFKDAAGNPLTLSGFKVIRDDPGIDLWPDATTLYTRVLAGHVGPEAEDEAELIAGGILRIRVRDFLRQLTSFRGSGPSALAGLRGLARFNALFLGELRRIYASPRKLTRRLDHRVRRRA